VKVQYDETTGAVTAAADNLTDANNVANFATNIDPAMMIGGRFTVIDPNSGWELALANRAPPPTQRQHRPRRRIRRPRPPTPTSPRRLHRTEDRHRLHRRDTRHLHRRRHRHRHEQSRHDHRRHTHHPDLRPVQRQSASQLRRLHASRHQQPSLCRLARWPPPLRHRTPHTRRRIGQRRPRRRSTNRPPVRQG
jgi:hypothetical protein